MGKKIQRDPQDVEIANTILERYNPETKDDVQKYLGQYLRQCYKEK